MLFVADAPWCGHCKKLAPDYSEAARVLKTENSPVKLAKIDGSEYNLVMEKYEAKGFPTTNCRVVFQLGLSSQPVFKLL